MGWSSMHGWCDVCKQKSAHSIWVTGVTLWGSSLHRVVCLQLSTLLPKFCFFLLSLDVVSPCWEILGGGDLEQDAVTCPLLFFLWLYRREPSRSPPSCRLRRDFMQCLRPAALSKLWQWLTAEAGARSLSSSSSLCLYPRRLHEHQNRSSPGSNCEKESLCPFLYFFT